LIALGNTIAADEALRFASHKLDATDDPEVADAIAAAREGAAHLRRVLARKAGV
jgi:hypothetical protein